MFCQNCGKQLSDGAKFCRYCGAAQNMVPSASPSAARPAPPPARPAPSAPPPVRTSSTPAAPANAGKPGSKWGLILSLAVVAVLGYVIFFWDPQAQPASAPASSSNVVLSPFASESEDQPEAPGLTPQPATPAPAVDARIPNYQPTDPQWTTLRYEWYCLNGVDTMWLEMPIDVQMYTYYRNLERYMGVENYHYYIDDTNNRSIISEIVRVLQDVGNSLSYTDMDMIREVVKFVQDIIEYEYDITSTGEIEYPRYPIETLYERRGDCEDTAILMAGLLRELGYEVGFLHLPQHLAVAVRGTDDYTDTAYYEINGRRYVYIESTGSGWNIGDIPEDFQQTEAEFTLIS